MKINVLIEKNDELNQSATARSGLLRLAVPRKGTQDWGRTLRLNLATQASLGATSSLVEEWDLLARRLNAPPQLRPGWLVAWWKAFGRHELRIFLARRGSELAGVLPMIERGGHLVAAGNVHTPGLDLLADGVEAADALAGLTFEGGPRRLSAVNLHPAGQAFRALLHAAHGHGYRIVLRHYRCSPYLDLIGNWEEYRSRLSKKLLKNLRSKDRQLRRRGTLSFEVADGSSNLDGYLREACEVEASGWKGVNGTAILSAPQTRGFYTELARWAAAEGLLRICFLRFDGRAIAMCYQLEQGGIAYWLKVGYAQDFAHYSPGMLLFQRIIRDGFAKGLGRIEFCGTGERYKFDWTRTASEWLRFEAFAPTPRGYLAMGAFNYIRPLVTRLPRFKRPPFRRLVRSSR